MNKRTAPPPETVTVYQCACHGAGLSVEAWTGRLHAGQTSGYIEIWLWNLGRCDHMPPFRSWHYRLRHIWLALRGKETGESGIMMESETARAMAMAILKAVNGLKASDADTD